jgi:hypothetical protein
MMMTEEKLGTAAKSCDWKPEMFEMFPDIVILARDAGMRKGRELYLLSYPYGKPGLEPSNHLRTRQHDGRGGEE